MNQTLLIPDEWRTLVDLLRCAIHNLPPAENLNQADWSNLLRQARAHRIEHFLYPWLSCSLPEKFALHAKVANNSVGAAWRTLALEHLQTTTKRRRQATLILQHFAQNNIAVIPLKGTWLSEALYAEPSQRHMVDIDLLVQSNDIKEALRILNTLGYSSNKINLQSEFCYEAKFIRQDSDLPLELHWNVESQMSGRIPIPEISRIWERATAATLLEQPASKLSNEDLITHLVQHILHHQFAVPLKNYIDLALLALDKTPSLNARALKIAAADWKTGRSVGFVFAMLNRIFDTPMPSAVVEPGLTDNTALIQQAWSVVFNLPPAKSRIREMNLLKYSEATTVGRLKHIFKRIFMPKSYMVVHYPYAQSSLLLPLAWLMRTIRLIHQTGRQLLTADTRSKSILNNASARRDLVNTLLNETTRQ
jgi:hypothetical protein